MTFRTITVKDRYSKVCKGICGFKRSSSCDYEISKAIQWEKGEIRMPPASKLEFMVDMIGLTSNARA